MTDQKDDVKVEEDETLEAEYADWALRLIGKTIAGRYRLVAKIAEGGMGLVFRARQEPLGRDVAIKIISSHYLKSDDAIERFEREAKGMSALQHANVVTIFDFGSEKGLSFIVMEYIDGETLADVMRRRPRVSMKTFIQLGPQILAGVGAAHSKGIIHRDIKPSNVIMSRDAKGNIAAKILDFGLARLVDEASELTKKSLVGTFAFVSPEQILGESVDARSDVYALATLFYFMLSGEMPFGETKGMNLLYRQAHEDPKPLIENLSADHDVPMDLIHVIQACLAKDPNLRPRDANELKELIDPIVEGWERSAFMDSSGRLFDRSQMSSPTLSFSPADIPFHSTSNLSSSHLSSPHLSSSHLSSPHLSPSQIIERKSSKTSLVLGGVVILLLLGAIGYLVMTQPEEGAPGGEVSLDEKANIVSSLDQAEAYLDKGEHAKAERLLKRISGKVETYPELLIRAIELEDEAAIDRLFAQARVSTTSGDKSDAIEKYKLILERDANNIKALDLLKSLVSAAEVGDADAVFGSLRVSADQVGVLFVDDIPFGPTPNMAKIPVGSHRLEIRSAGFKTWSKTVDVKEGDNSGIEVKLEAEASTESAVARVKARKKKKKRPRRRKVAAKRVAKVEATPPTKPDPKPAELAELSLKKADSAPVPPAPKVVEKKPDPKPVVATTTKTPPSKPTTAPKPVVKKTLKPSVTVGSLVIDGGMNRGKASEVAGKLRRVVSQCYSKTYAAHPFKGVIKIRVDVTPDGRARAMKLKVPPESNIGKCLGVTFKKVAYPPSISGGSITMPYSLKMVE